MTDNDEKKKPDSVAVQLVRYALENYTLGVTETGDAFGVHAQDRPHIAKMIRGGRNGLRAELARWFFTEHSMVPSQQGIADACSVLEGYAGQADPQQVSLRVAEHNGTVYIDMGDSDGHIIEISGGTWDISVRAPVLFRRTKLTGAMPKPYVDGDVSRLWTFVHIADEDRPLVLSWLVAALIQSNVAHTILALLAEHGSAKSTMTRCLVDLIDPSSVPLRKTPRDAEGWVTAANASWVVALDNMSGPIPLWFSDCLCRACTGDGDVRRQLYTDGDVSVISFRRVVVFNGIDVMVTQGDLADRLLRVHLHRIEDDKRRGDEELAALWADARPDVLGGLLNLAASVHHRLASITVPKLPRMADYARVLAGVDDVMGTNGLAHYREQCKRLAADTLDDAFIAAIVKHRHCCTDATSAAILADITQVITAADSEWRAPRGWPHNAREVTAQLTRHAPAMRAQGWNVEDDGGRNKRGIMQWTIYPPGPEKACNPDPPSLPGPPTETPLTRDDGEAEKAGQECRPSLDEQPPCRFCGQPMAAPVSIERGYCEGCRLTEGREQVTA